MGRPLGTNDIKAEWDYVHRSNFERTAFWDIYWIRKARDLYESARKLEPEVVLVWKSYRAHVENLSSPLMPDYYQGAYFMLLAFAMENLLKGAAVSRHSNRYRVEFRSTLKFPQELVEHDLVKLARFIDLEFTLKEEDLFRRLTRSAIWYGRYPVPLSYIKMSGKEKFVDGNEYLVSWFGGDDIPRLNALMSSLPARLDLDESCWTNVTQTGNAPEVS